MPAAYKLELPVNRTNLAENREGVIQYRAVPATQLYTFVTTGIAQL